MATLFSEAWMGQLKERWNTEPKVVGPLQEAGFSARIGYGFKGEEHPRAMLVIDNGMVSIAGGYDGGGVDWDLRAAPEKWVEWIEGGFGLIKLGPAVATGALQFAKGNYRQMIRNPALSNPFLHHFELMSGISD